MATRGRAANVLDQDACFRRYQELHARALATALRDLVPASFVTMPRRVGLLPLPLCSCVPPPVFLCDMKYETKVLYPHACKDMSKD